MLNKAEALPVVSLAVMSQVPGGWLTGEVDRHRNEIQAGADIPFLLNDLAVVALGGRRDVGALCPDGRDGVDLPGAPTVGTPNKLMSA